MKYTAHFFQCEKMIYSINSFIYSHYSISQTDEGQNEKLGNGDACTFEVSLSLHNYTCSLCPVVHCFYFVLFKLPHMRHLKMHQDSESTPTQHCCQPSSSSRIFQEQVGWVRHLCTVSSHGHIWHCSGAHLVHSGVLAEWSYI